MPVLRKEEAGLLFIHIPKTGGSSIEWAFRDMGWAINTVDGNRGRRTINHYRRTTPQHEHGEVLASLYRLERFDGIFAYVRDPLARIISEYVFRNTSKDTPVDTSASAVETWVRSSLKRTLVDPYHHDNHLRPQHEFLVPGTRVYRFEDGLDDGLKDLSSYTGLELPTSVPRRNTASERTGVSSRDVEISANTRRLVASFYAEDYSRFGYTLPEN